MLCETITVTVIIVTMKEAVGLCGVVIRPLFKKLARSLLFPCSKRTIIIILLPHRPVILELSIVRLVLVALVNQ